MTYLAAQKMNSLSEIQSNDSIVKRFAVLKRKERLAHAYLFIGPTDIGKGETALAIAKLVNCEANKEGLYCDICPTCVKINTRSHPDVTLIDNGFGETIKIEQIRGILQRNKLRPLMARKKVFIIKNIENLTLDAANAFLKTLEEPTNDSLLLLTTSVPEKNLDTIRSRCHAIHFKPIANNDLIEILTQQHNVNNTNAHFLAYFAQGCLGSAKRLKDSNYLKRKNEIINTFVLNRPDDSELKDICADKEATKELLDILSSWIRDSILAKAHVADERLIHLDRIVELQIFKQKYSFKELETMDKSVVKMHQLLADNLNIKLPLLIIGEQLWIK